MALNIMMSLILRFKGTKYEQETFFVKDPNENVLEIKTLTSNPA